MGVGYTTWHRAAKKTSLRSILAEIREETYFLFLFLKEIREETPWFLWVKSTLHSCLASKSCTALLRPRGLSVACQAPLVHDIFLARILEWVAASFSRESSWPRGRTCNSCVGSNKHYICWQADSLSLSLQVLHRGYRKCRRTEERVCFTCSRSSKNSYVGWGVEMMVGAKENVLGHKRLRSGQRPEQVGQGFNKLCVMGRTWKVLSKVWHDPT